MKLLLISDEESAYLWDHYQPGHLAGVDMILACGDLKRSYLEFLVTMTNKPLYYVNGNHDGAFLQQPPEGCVCLEDRVAADNGVRLAGLGGCLLYNGGPFQYTERQMKRRLFRLNLKLWRAGGLDIMLTHAPPRGFGDTEDWAHRGFECFVALIDRWHPRFFVHGHVHRSYNFRIPRALQRGNTTIINACGWQILDTEHPPEAVKI